jgi:hypothetical protein
VSPVDSEQLRLLTWEAQDDLLVAEIDEVVGVRDAPEQLLDPLDTTWPEASDQLIDGLIHWAMVLRHADVDLRASTDPLIAVRDRGPTT